MANGMVPPGYRAVPIGSAATLEELDTLAPMEESAAEGTLMLARLDFSELPSAEALAELNRKCLDQGVPPWPGYGYIVYADTDRPSVYLAWQKGFAWLPVIGGILAVTVLPVLIGIGLFALMPEALQELINTMMQMGMMVVVMFMMMMVMKPMMKSSGSRKLEEGRR